MQVGYPEVSAVARYLLNTPAKRFRPLLLLLMHRLLRCCCCSSSSPSSSSNTPGEKGDNKGDNKDLSLIMIPIAELIHTATLMHDDVLDDSCIRRGNPSTHLIFGNKKAVLGGDFLLARASVIAASTGIPEVCLRVSRVLEDLIKGELIQTLKYNADIDKSVDLLLAKTYHKTAALMAESCACLAILSGVSRVWIDWCYNIGGLIGLIFQLIDDELDLQENTKKTGKPSLNDLKNGVLTAPLLLAAVEYPQQLLPLLQRQLQQEGDAAYAAKKIKEGAAIPRARLLSRVYVHHVLLLLQSLPQQTQQQQNAAADLASLLLWLLQQTNSGAQGAPHASGAPGAPDKGAPQSASGAPQASGAPHEGAP